MTFNYIFPPWARQLMLVVVLAQCLDTVRIWRKGTDSNSTLASFGVWFPESGDVSCLLWMGWLSLQTELVHNLGYLLCSKLQLIEQVAAVSIVALKQIHLCSNCALSWMWRSLMPWSLLGWTSGLCFTWTGLEDHSEVIIGPHSSGCT